VLFNEIIELGDNLRQAKSIEEQYSLSEEAAKKVFQLLDMIAGDIIAYNIQSVGISPLPSTTFTEGESGDFIEPSSQNDRYVKRALAKLIMGLSPILENAQIPAGVIARDLIEMSKDNGSSATLLTPAIKKEGKKDNRDLKAAARLRVCEVVYFEAGRKNISIEDTLFCLRQINNNKNDNMHSSTIRAWERIRKGFPKNKEIEARSKGINSSNFHPDSEMQTLNKLWKFATS
jgi:hypothetical protein